MSEPRILGPTDRATIRQSWAPYRGGQMADDLLALLDTCDAMENDALGVLHDAGWRIVKTSPICCEKCEHANGVRITDEWSPAEAAVLDTTRQEQTDGE